MKTEFGEVDWLSYNIYHSVDYLDFLNDELFKRLRAYGNFLGDRYFVVRYFDKIGPHVRFRVKYISANKIGISELIDDLLNGLNFKEFEYEQELARYGGKYGMRISQELFILATSFLLNVSSFLKITNALSMALVIVANKVILRAFLSNQKKLNQFFEHAMFCRINYLKNLGIAKEKALEKIEDYYENIKEDIHSILKILFEDECFLNAVFLYASGVSRCADEYKNEVFEMTISYREFGILESLVHMNYNRFGISNFDESLMSYVSIMMSEDVQMMLREVVNGSREDR